LGSISGSIVPNANLKPSRVSETELGLDLRMFNNRVNFDFAIYSKITNDQIVGVQISDAPGFTNTRINSGKSSNNGFEVLLSLVPIKKKNFTWEFTANTAYNKTEAAFRGWITTGTTAQYFSDGIRAHMDQMAVYDAGCAISASARDSYLAATPLNVGSELDQINTQYWISSFLNGPEVFANFRRSGFPLLTPNPYGQPTNPDVPNGTFIRRLTYPTSEASVNATNLNAAIAAQGADLLSTRIWWDK